MGAALSAFPNLVRNWYYPDDENIKAELAGVYRPVIPTEDRQKLIKKLYEKVQHGEYATCSDEVRDLVERSYIDIMTRRLW